MKSILTTNLGSTTTYFVGAHYEVTDGVITKYYGVYGANSATGATRIAIPQGDDVRKAGTLYYMLSDHLGSTSIVTFENGSLVSQTKYKA